jgi:hypothetical protein
MQPHLGSVVLCLLLHSVVGCKTLLSFYATCGKRCTTSAECKTNRLAVLRVKSGLDPHMIIKLEAGLKSPSLVMLALCFWHISYLMLNVGWYILILY